MILLGGSVGEISDCEKKVLYEPGGAMTQVSAQSLHPSSLERNGRKVERKFQEVGNQVIFFSINTYYVKSSTCTSIACA